MKTNVNVSKQELKRVLTKVVGTQFVTVVFRKNDKVHKVNGQVFDHTTNIVCFRQASNGEIFYFDLNKLLVVSTRRFVLRREK